MEFLKPALEMETEMRIGSCLSPSVADRPLRPANDRRLGEPLPHQLANRTRTHLLAINLYPVGTIRY